MVKEKEIEDKRKQLQTLILDQITSNSSNSATTEADRKFIDYFRDDLRQILQIIDTHEIESFLAMKEGPTPELISNIIGKYQQFIYQETHYEIMHHELCRQEEELTTEFEKVRCQFKQLKHATFNEHGLEQKIISSAKQILPELDEYSVNKISKAMENYVDPWDLPINLSYTTFQSVVSTTAKMLQILSHISHLLSNLDGQVRMWSEKNQNDRIVNMYQISV